jgi:AcrR family transcriptional regulator
MIPMSKNILTREQILEAAEIMLRRFGPDKASVVDVAKHLGVTHGSIYRHFPSKAALREAVAELWLKRALPDLTEIVGSDLPPAEKLYQWLRILIAGKRARAADDPELFATYVQLATETQDVISNHISTLSAQVETILKEGVAVKEFSIRDIPNTARAIFLATTRFHNPAHMAEWKDPTIDAQFDDVWLLILSGLRNGHPK